MDPDDNRKISRKYKKARREYLQSNDEEESRVVAATSALALDPGFEAVAVDIGIHSVQPTPQFHGSAPVPGSSGGFSSPQQPQTIQGTMGVVTPQFGSGEEEPGVPEVCEAVPLTNVGTNEEFCGFCEPVYEENDFDGNSQEASRFAIDFAEDFEPSVFTDDVGRNNLIYEGANMNVMESVTAILSYAVSEHISGAGLARLLSLISLHLPTKNNFFKTNSEFFKILEDKEEPLEISYYCSLCLKKRESSSDLCDTCTDEKRSVCYFIHFPLVPQVKKLYSRPDFLSDIQYKNNRVKKNVENHEDIYDGKAYKKAEHHFSSGTHNISLMWNTDGLQVFKSVLFSLWPFFFIVNELPPHKRYLSENMLIGGIWCGPSKPHPNIFLRPIHDDLKTLEAGIIVNGGLKIHVKLLCGTCDAPARAYFLNMKIHSGFYSCHMCLCKGENSNDTGDVTVFPFERHFQPRTLQQYEGQVKFAVENRVLLHKDLQNDERCAGIKGPSILAYMLDDVFASTAIDSMHCIYLGVMRQMLVLMFDSSYKDEGFSALKKIKTVNHRLFNVTPPHFVDRLPDPVDKIIYWKASVLRAFLFHFSLCILHDVLEPEYFEHFVSFVKAISILNSSSVSPGDIEISSSLLTQFVERFQTLYGKRHMTHNIHMLLHVSANVDYLAPLWVTNCFKFEDMNGRVTQLVHGTRYAGIQVCSNLSVVTRLPLMVHNLNNPAVKDFCDQLRYKGLSLRVSEKISDNMLCVGELTDLSIKDDWIVHEFSQIVLNPSANSLKLFNRLYKDKMLYVSSSYGRGKRISSFVKYSVNNSLEIGNIVNFVRFSPVGENPQYFAVVQRLQTSLPFQTNDVTITHVHQVHYPYVAIDIIPIVKLHTVLFKTDVSDTVFVSEPLNHFELE